MLEVCEAQDGVHRAQRRGTVCKLSGEALRVLTRATEGGCGTQRWTFGVPAGKGGGGQSDEGDVEEGQEGPHVR